MPFPVAFQDDFRSSNHAWREIVDRPPENPQIDSSVAMRKLISHSVGALQMEIRVSLGKAGIDLQDLARSLTEHLDTLPDRKVSKLIRLKLSKIHRVDKARYSFTPLDDIGAELAEVKLAVVLQSGVSSRSMRSAIVRRSPPGVSTST